MIQGKFLHVKFSEKIRNAIYRHMILCMLYNPKSLALLTNYKYLLNKKKPHRNAAFVKNLKILVL